MAVTIQQIAERAGVSRGTVDRALNHRGRISPDVEEKIQSIARELGYEPKHKRSRVNKVSKGKSKIHKIGIITQLADTSFMLEVNRGIREAKRELEERGIQVLVMEGRSVDEKEQAAAIEKLVEQGMEGLALMPVDSDLIREKINELTEKKGIPVVTFNSDIVGTKRSCYIGLDNRKSGRTAAGLMGTMAREGGKILIITGFLSNSVSSQRVDGFIETMKADFPEMELAGVQTSFDREEEVEQIIMNAISLFPDLKGIFVASSGQTGVYKAFEKLELDRRPYVIVYDLTPENKLALKNKTVDFLIDQEGFEQGYRALFLLTDGSPADQIHTEISIRNRYNID